LHRQQHGTDKQNIEFAPAGKVSAEALACDLNFFTFLAYSDMFWLFLTCKYNKQKYLVKRFFATFKVLRPETFETETRKNGSQGQVSPLHH